MVLIRPKNVVCPTKWFFLFLHSGVLAILFRLPHLCTTPLTHIYKPFLNSKKKISFDEFFFGPTRVFTDLGKICAASRILHRSLSRFRDFLHEPGEFRKKSYIVFLESFASLSTISRLWNFWNPDYTIRNKKGKNLWTPTRPQKFFFVFPSRATSYHSRNRVKGCLVTPYRPF